MKTVEKEVKEIVKVNVATIKDFVKFLEEKGVLFEFIQNAMNLEPAEYTRSRPVFNCGRDLLSNFEQYVEYVRHIKSPNKDWYKRLLLDSFTFSSSKEGHMFWNEISEEWMEFLDKNRIKSFEPVFE